MSLLEQDDNSLGTKLALWLYSTSNIVGCLFALIGMGLYFTNIIDSYWPLIVTGMYLVGFFIIPTQDDTQELNEDRFNEDNIVEALEATIKKIGSRLPEAAKATLISIQSTVESLVIALKAEDQVDVKSRATIISAVTRYLPQTLMSYLKLPPAFALVHHGPSGKTAQTLLIEQLNALDTELTQILKNIYNKDLEQLVINGRFLEEKFGS